MNYTGPIFRPPPEASTPLLQVTVGCAHNKCNYCTMYRSVQFTTEPMEQIEADILELKASYGSLTRIFLINGDAFVLSADKLKAISDRIIHHFPEMETISMYASVRNIMTKTDEQLSMLKDARINDLWIGLETGSPDVLDYLNKGYAMDDAYEQVGRLNRAGIRHNDIFMLGVAGHDRGIDNAVKTAKLINRLHPQMVGFTTMGIFEGSDIAADVAQGRFIQANELETLMETRVLVESIDLPGIQFATAHPSNMAPIVGILPRDRQHLLDIIDQIIKTTDPKVLAGNKQRNSL